MTRGALLGAASLVVAGPLLSPCRADPVEVQYIKYCSSCHGEDGSGKGRAARVLKTFPGNFTDCEAMRARNREEVVRLITEGGTAVGKSSQMPAFGRKLSAKEIEALAGYVTTNFCKSD